MQIRQKSIYVYVCYKYVRVIKNSIKHVVTPLISILVSFCSYGQIEVGAGLTQNLNFPSLSFEVTTVLRIGLSSHFSLYEKIKNNYYLFDSNISLGQNSSFYVGTSIGIKHQKGQNKYRAGNISIDYPVDKTLIAFAPSIGYHKNIDFKIWYLMSVEDIQKNENVNLSGSWNLSLFFLVNLSQKASSNTSN
jgi:hypothetical protein